RAYSIPRMPDAPLILVVEDDSDTRELVIEVLREDGYRVAGAGNGQEALEILAREPRPPALILLDLMMPVMNGWEFLDVMTRVKGMTAVLVLVLSADPARQLAAQRGVVAVIGKPFDLGRLLRLVRAVTKSQMM